MKKKISLILGVLSFLALFLLINNRSGATEDLTHCLFKTKSEWNQTCTQCPEKSGTYRVYFRNDCFRKLDVKVAVQEKDLRWRTFQFQAMSPNDIISAYACKGTGKYLYWVKDSNDDSIEFPSDEQINTENAK